MQQRINATLSAVFDLYGTIGSAVSTEYQQVHQGQPQPQQQQQQQGSQGQTWGDAAGVARYNIGDGWGYGGGGGWYGGYDGWGGSAQSNWGWYEEAGDHAGPTAEVGEAGMDTTSIQVPKWMRRQAASDADHGERSWKKGRSDEEEGTGSKTGVADGAAQGTSGGSTDGQRQGGAGGAGGSAGTEDKGAAAEGTEALAARTEEVLRQATVDGVAIDPAAIAAMGRVELEAWAKHNLL